MCVKKIIYCCNYTKIPDVWWEHLDLVTHEISQNVFNYFFFFNSAQITKYAYANIL